MGFSSQFQPILGDSLLPKLQQLFGPIQGGSLSSKQVEGDLPLFAYFSWGPSPSHCELQSIFRKPHMGNLPTTNYVTSFCDGKYHFVLSLNSDHQAGIAFLQWKIAFPSTVLFLNFRPSQDLDQIISCTSRSALCESIFYMQFSPYFSWHTFWSSCVWDTPYCKIIFSALKMSCHLFRPYIPICWCDLMVLSHFKEDLCT